MNPNDPNVVLLEVVAERLGAALRERLVFIVPDLEDKLLALANLV